MKVWLCLDKTETLSDWDVDHNTKEQYKQAHNECSTISQNVYLRFLQKYL